MRLIWLKGGKWLGLDRLMGSVVGTFTCCRSSWLHNCSITAVYVTLLLNIFRKEGHDLPKTTTDIHSSTLVPANVDKGRFMIKGDLIGTLNMKFAYNFGVWRGDLRRRKFAMHPRELRLNRPVHTGEDGFLELIRTIRHGQNGNRRL